MVEGIENRLQSVKQRQAEAQRRHATAEAKLDQVRAERQRLLDGLKEHGFDTPDAARERVTELKDQVEKILTDIEEKVSSL